MIGSQAILGSYTEEVLPTGATMSVEVDLAPLNDDDAGTLATRIDGVLGEWSPFHETHGFYVQGVGRETAVLPTGWEERLVPVQGPGTSGRVGLCLEPHDLCVAKLAAAREKDSGSLVRWWTPAFLSPTRSLSVRSRWRNRTRERGPRSSVGSPRSDRRRGGGRAWSYDTTRSTKSIRTPKDDLVGYTTGTHEI